MTKSRHSKRLAIVLSLTFHFALFTQVIFAPPPIPHSIAGTIFHRDGATQVPLGTDFKINGTNSSDFLQSETRIPVPGLTGRYFETINGSDNDTVMVLAWNQTTYGNVTVLLLGDMDGVNVYLNITRPSETNVSIVAPGNNSQFVPDFLFNLTANVSIIGGQNGINCNASINMSNESMVNLSSTEMYIHELGNISLGDSNHTTWNLTTNQQGSVNITVNAYCTNQTLNFDNLDTEFITVEVADIISPIIALISPANNTESASQNINFAYNVSDLSDIANCSLIINDAINLTNSTPIVKETEQIITQTLSNGFYNWTINCTDVAGNIGTAPAYNLTVNGSLPLLTNLTVTDPIDLLSGTHTTVFCNATLTTFSDETNISIVNATLFDNSITTYQSQDDNNNHYTNTSCLNVSSFNGVTNYTCGFPIQYYANNASWSCNLTATDFANQTVFDVVNTSVNELVSIRLNTTVLNYGLLGINNISNTSNITIINLGNKDLNISVEGFGDVPGDGTGMNCTPSGNISVNQQRYFYNYTRDYDSMINLTSASTPVANFTLYQRTNDIGHVSDVNSTFWSIRVPIGTRGNCNGTIMMAASIV